MSVGGGAVGETAGQAENSERVCLYAEKESPKYEKAAMKFLRRYLDKKEPTARVLAR